MIIAHNRFYSYTFLLSLLYFKPPPPIPPNRPPSKLAKAGLESKPDRGKPDRGDAGAGAGAGGGRGGDGGGGGGGGNSNIGCNLS